MKRARRILAGWLLGAGLAPAGAAEPPTVLLIGDDRHPPYSHVEDGHAAGLYVDVLTQALARAGYRAEFHLMPWRRALLAVQAGAAMAIFPPHRFAAERPFLDAYSPPIYDEEPVLLCRRAALLHRTRSRWPEDFDDLRFGLAAGVLMGGADFQAGVAAGRFRAEALGNIDVNLRKLASGRTDCHLNDLHTLQWAAAHLPAPARADWVVAVRLPVESGHLAYRRDDDGRFGAERERFARRVDAALLAMRADGSLNTIAARWRTAERLPDWENQLRVAAPAR